MKNLFVFVLLFFSVSLFAQKVKETKIITNPDNGEAPYLFSYDENSGTYAVSLYDTITNKYYILSNKGNSTKHSNFFLSNVIYDADGNYYLTAVDDIDTSDSGSTKNYFTKNGKDLFSYEYINENIVTDGRYIYFLASDSAGDRMMKYDIRKNKFENGRKYNYVYLCYSPIPSGFSNREYVFTPGLTKNNDVYYIASRNDEEFLVIGDEEQKHYKNIDANSVTEEKKGNLCYIAMNPENDTSTYSVVVQGNKEYKKCYNARGPILFSDDNIPVYAASDTPAEYSAVHNVYIGNQKGKYYDNDISNITVSENGKIAYVATQTINDSETYCFVVTDGKEGKKYDNILSIVFSKDDKPVYIASIDTNYFVVSGIQEQKYKYSFIYNLFISPKGQIAYVGQDYNVVDSVQQSKLYINIGNNVFGPYHFEYYEPETQYDLIYFDDKDNYAYLAANDSNFSEESILYKLYTKNWQSDSFDYIDYTQVYDGNVYYSGYNSGTDISRIYKNKNKIAGDYKRIYNYKFNLDDEEITFVGLKNNIYYFVKIEL